MLPRPPSFALPLLLRDALEDCVASLPLPSLWLAPRRLELDCRPELACRLELFRDALRPVDPLLFARDPLLRALDPLLRPLERVPLLSLCARLPLLRDVLPD